MARKIVYTTAYKISHGAEPRGRGAWMFFNMATETEVTVTGTYTEAKRQLTAGEWMVLP